MKLHYRTQCAHHHGPVKLDKSPRFDRHIENYIRELFEEREISEAQKQKLWGHYYSKLARGLDKGYSPKLKHYDAELAQALKYNLAEFSAFKETAFRKTLQGMLGGGKFPTWGEFREKAVAVSGDYNLRWLETEYRHTVASANMAKKWKGFERNKDLYPNLKYDAVNDGRTRERHRGWDGTVLPMDDPWWDTHYPPNDWGCRCDAVQVDDPVTKKVPPGEVKKGFANNPAKSGKVFGDVVYANGFTGKELKAAGDFAKKQFARLGRYSSNYVSYRRYLKDPDYADVKFDGKSGGMKATHQLHSFHKKDGHYEKEARDILFRNGDEVILIKELDIKGEAVIRGQRVPDGFLNKATMEISTILGSGKNTISRALMHCRGKSAKVAMLYFPDKSLFSKERLSRGISKYRGQASYRFEKIFYILEGKVVEFKE